LALFRKRVADAFKGPLVDDDAIQIGTLLQHLNEGLPVDEMFDTEEAVACGDEMTLANEIMVHDGVVYKI
jgi:hypothetical protein